MSDDLHRDTEDQETTEPKAKGKQGSGGRKPDAKASRAVDPRMQQMLDVEPRWYDRLRGPVGGLGLVVIVVGLGILARKGEVSTAVKVVGITGLAMLLFWLVTGLAGLWAGPGRRSAQASATNIIWGILVLAALVGINWMTYRRSIRVDVTESKYYALSEQTIEVVKNLDQHVTMTAFVAPETPGSRLIRNTVREYKLLPQSKLEVSFLDPKKAATSALMESMDVAKQENVVVVQSGDKTETVRIYQPEKLEEKLTSAIMAVTTGTKPKVYFLTGHGEYQPDPQVYGGPSWSVVKTLLTDQQYEVATLDLTRDVSRGESVFESIAKGEDADGADDDEGDDADGTPESSNVRIPADCACLVIAGAQTPLFPEETQAIKDYLNNNGHLVVALSMGMESDLLRQKRITGPDLNDILQEYDIRVGDGWVIEPTVDIFGQRSLSDRVQATEFGNHTVTRGLTVVELPATRPVHYEGTPEPNPMGGPPPPSMGSEIAKSHGSAWAESDIMSSPVQKDEGEQSGPLPLAVAYGVSDEDRPSPVPGAPPPPDVETPRIVVFGSAMAFTDQYMTMPVFSNDALITKAIAWATGRAELVTVPPKNFAKKEMMVTSSQRSAIVLVHVLVLVAIVGTGGYVWWRRR